MSGAAKKIETDGVQGTFEYAAPGTNFSLRYASPDREVNTGTFEEKTVFIHNARPVVSELTLKTCGFELVNSRSRVNFYDKQEAEARYPAEIEKVLLDLTGADKAVLFGPCRRHTSKPSPFIRHAATDVHVDYEVPEARTMSKRLLGLKPQDELPYSRYMAINIWRVLSDPPQDRPLAVLDGRSVRTQSGARNTLLIVDEMPSRLDMLKAPPPNDDALPHGFVFHYDPAHRWYYYPNMTRDEVLFFKLYDSVEQGPWRSPHASFIDKTVPPDAPARESYEIRSFVYFR